MEPELVPGDFVFCTVKGDLSDYAHLSPAASVLEAEGLTLILTSDIAAREQFECSGNYRKITLRVHSSLEAVGLTAAISERLTAASISANVVAGFYHDHVYVQSSKAEAAMGVLRALSQEQK